MAAAPAPSLLDLLTQEAPLPRTPAVRTPHSSSRRSHHRRRSSHGSTNPVPSSRPPEPPASPADTAQTVAAVLSAYTGRFLKDPLFRAALRAKCAPFLDIPDPSPVLHNLNLAVGSIDRLADDCSSLAAGDSRDNKIRSLRNSIRLLSIVASLNGAGAADTGGVPSAHLTACAQLYLAVVYRIERNDKTSARHLLQVFIDAPRLARRTLLPDLWEHIFLPHLLHVKVWYSKEVEAAAAAVAGGDGVKAVDAAYNEQLDHGTAEFAKYYKEWLNSGAMPSPAPVIPLPARSCYVSPRRKRPVAMPPRKSINRSLYRAVFGLPEETDAGGGGDDGDGELDRKLEELAHTDSGMGIIRKQDHRDMQQKQQQQEEICEQKAPTPRKSYWLFSCRSDSTRNAARCQAKKEPPAAPADRDQGDHHESISSLERAAVLISKSDNLHKCEHAVRVVARTWLLESHDQNPYAEAFLSAPAFVEGLLEVAFTSKDKEVLDAAVAVLAELVLRSDANRQVVLSADPQLEIFLKLLRSEHHFLKGAALLYLLRPKAKQMLSTEWIPAALHVLDWGGDSPAIFCAKCTPKAAAFYMLDQILTGFDVDRNAENAKQLVALGGLDLLIRGLDGGDGRERRSCVALLIACIQGDGSCRQYLAANVKKESIVRLLAGNQRKSSGSSLFFLSELMCLHRTTQIVRFTRELRDEGRLNTMHILLVYLQQAPAAQRPLAAAVLLQLDLLGDPQRRSVYREEAVDAIVAALEQQHPQGRRAQEHCARALLLLAGRFSASGQSAAEALLLRKAGIDESLAESFRRTEIFMERSSRAEEEKVTEERLKKLAVGLLAAGGRRLLVALSGCISAGIPVLAKWCVITVAWMSCSLCSPAAGSAAAAAQPVLMSAVLAPRLLESLSYDRPLEERVLSSLSLLNFMRHPDCMSEMLPLPGGTIESLQDLAEVTWTAKELLLLSCHHH